MNRGFPGQTLYPLGFSCCTFRLNRGVSRVAAFFRVSHHSIVKSMTFSRFGAGPNGPIEYAILTEDKIDGALSVQQKSMRQENVALGVGVYEEDGAAEAMLLVFRQVIKDGFTIIAVDAKSGEVVGAVFNKLHVPLAIGEVDPLVEVVENNVKPRASLALINFLDDVESRVDVFERYDTKAAMEIFYVGIDPNYQGYRIGQGLVERSIQLAKSLGDDEKRERSIVPGVVFGVFTSNFSQRIAEKLNFEFLATVRYDEYDVEGTKMSERIEKEHQTAKLGALKL